MFSFFYYKAERGKNMNGFSNYSWRFMEGFSPDFIKGLPSNALLIDIPHAAKEMPLSYFDELDYQKTYTYEKTFEASSLKANEVALLRFEGVMLKFHVYLNEKDLGEYLSGWVPVDVDVTEALKEGENRLIVVVDAKEDSLVPPFGGSVDYLTFAGIYRPVRLLVLPLTHWKHLYIHADQTGDISINKKITNSSGKETILYEIYDGKKKVLESNNDQFKLPRPHLWDITDPYLYTLKASLTSDSGSETKTIRFGFRTAVFQEDGFYLNNKKIKLRGLNRHQNYPYVGPSLPKGAQEDDVNVIKHELGCNIVRTSHYPQSEDFLSACDEQGLLLIDEVPGWQYLSKEKAWRDHFYYLLEGMVKKECNHPCLIAYGTRVDESADDHDLYSHAQKIVHTLDPYRQTLGVRNFKTSECLEDIYCYNDFSCASIEHGLDKPSSIKGGKGKPKLISENNGHMFSTKYFDNASRRTESALRHLRVIDDAYKYDGLCGEIGWCAFDYNTHKAFGSDDHICHHGVTNIFRNPKESGYAYASQSDDRIVLEVANPPYAGDYDENLLHPLVVLTNCDYVELWKNNQYIGRFDPNKKSYPHLPHAPIFIDDFIGESFDEPLIKPRLRKKMKGMLNRVGEVGAAHLTFKDYLKYGPAFLSSGLSMSDMGTLLGKYFSGQSEALPNVWTVKGYKNGSLAKEQSFGPSTKFHLEVSSSKLSLVNEETYDVARVKIRCLDQYDNECHYTTKVLKMRTEGPIEIIGPKEVALLGDYAVYIRSKTTKSPAKATLFLETDLGVSSLEFVVK